MNHMRKGKTDTSFRKASIRAAVLVLAVGLGMSLLVSGGTFAKWTAAISQMTGANIQIGDWVAVEQPVISTESKLPDGNVGVEYRHQFEALNSDSATWTSSSLYGNLPSGMKLSRDGVLSGAPTYADTYTFRVAVKNIAGIDERPFTLVVHPVAPVFAASQVLPDAFDGKAYPSTTLTASGQNRVYEITSGSLPDGLVLQRYGTISGTPIGYGLFTFTVKVSNGGGSDSKEFTINLNSDFPYITATALPDATKDVYYYQLIAGSGPSPTYAITGGSLPNGMTLDPATGRISGYSRVHGLSNFTVSKTNSMGTATKDLSIYVRYAAPTITTSSLTTVRKNVPYSTQLEGIGEESTFAISEGRLPDGITLNPTTGLISGSAQEIGDFNVTFTRTNESGVATKSFKFQSLLAAPVITTKSMPDAFLESYYELQTTATGEEIVWSATGLPEGLSIDPSTGLISGIPTVTTNSWLYVTAANSGGSSKAQYFFYSKNAPPVITTTSMAAGEVGTFYSETFRATGTAISYSRWGGALPPGLNFDSSGVLSGTPTKYGTFPVTFAATTGGGTVYQSISLFMERDVPSIVETSLDTSAMQGVSYTKWFTGRGVDSTFSITAGSLPPGISYSSTNGWISGTPNVNAHGPYTFTVTKTNSVGTASQEFTLNVVHQTPTLTGSAAITQNRLGQNYTFTLPGVGNGATYSITNGALPSGITLNESTGVISGVSTVTGDFTFTIQKTNESGTVSKDYTFKVVHVAPNMKTTAFDTATVNVPYSMQLEATGLDITYLVDYGSFPDGMSFDLKTGVISGTSTTAGNFLLRIYATNSGGKSQQLQAYFTVAEVAPTIITTSLPQGVVGDSYSQKIEAVGENITYSATGLPNGFKIDSSTGVISGTPTIASSYAVIVSVKNHGNTVNQRFPMTVVTQAPTITLDSFPDGVIGKSYSQTLTGVGTSNTVTITEGALPPGMTMSSSNGTLGGTPNARGTYTFTITKTNVSGTVSKEFTLNIRYIVPTISTSAGAFTGATTGKSYVAYIVGVGQDVTHTVTDGSLPPGLTITTELPSEYGVIRGVPTTPGNYTFTVRKSNLDGEVSRQFSINVTGTPMIASLANEPSPGLLLLRSNPFL